MKFTVVGDPHLKNSNLHLVEKLFEKVESKGLPVVWLGDMLDTKEVIRGKCLNALVAFLKRSSLHHYILVGNHDWFNLECEEHSLESLKLLSNVTVVDSLFLEWNSGIAFMPYIHDLNQVKETLVQIPSHFTVFAHLEMNGYDFGNGHICRNNLTLNDIAQFKRVISGHFHKFQNDGILTYVGTPFSHSFGEANQQKVIAMYDAKTNDLTFEETGLRKHVSIEFNCDLLNEEKEHWIIDVDDVTWRENKYRVILTGTQENIDRFPKHIYDQGGTQGKLDIKWVSRPFDFVLNNVAIDENTSNDAQFCKWASEVKKLDQETIDLGLMIIGTVT